MPDGRSLNRLLCWLLNAREARLSTEAVSSVRAAEAEACDKVLGVRPHVLPLVGRRKKPSKEEEGGQRQRRGGGSEGDEGSDPVLDGKGRFQAEAELRALAALQSALPLELRRPLVAGGSRYWSRGLDALAATLLDPRAASTSSSLQEPEEESFCVGGGGDCWWVRLRPARMLAAALLLDRGAPPSQFEASNAKPLHPHLTSPLAPTTSVASASAAAFAFSSHTWQTLALALADLFVSAGLAEPPKPTVRAHDLAQFYLRGFLPLCVALVANKYGGGGGEGSLSRTGGGSGGGAAAMRDDDATAAADGSGLGSSEGSSSSLKAMVWPDPMFSLEAHGCCSSSEFLSSRRVALVFLRRQQLLVAGRFVCARRPFALAAYLRSAKGRAKLLPPPRQPSTSLLALPPSPSPLPPPPVWWCPWLHDLTLVVVSATHGMAAGCDPRELCPSSADSDSSPHPVVRHPLSEASVTAHVRRVFLGLPALQTTATAPASLPPPPPVVSSGAGGRDKGCWSGGFGSSSSNGSPSAKRVATAAAGLFASAQEVSEWVAEVTAPFSSTTTRARAVMARGELEARVESVLAALTADLPRHHPLRVSPCALSHHTTNSSSSSSVVVAGQRRVPLALTPLLEESRHRREKHLDQIILFGRGGAAGI